MGPRRLLLLTPRLTRGWLMDTVWATTVTATGATDTATPTPTATTATTARGPLMPSPPLRPLPPLRPIRGTDIDTVWATVATMADTAATTVWATVATGARSKKARHKRADTKTPASCFLHQ